MGGMARADAAVVLVQDDIHDSVVSVFDARYQYTVCSRGRALGGQAGKEDADIGRDPVPAAAFGLNPDPTGPVAPLAVGVDRDEKSGVARCPAAAACDAAMALPDRVRVVVGTAGKVPGPLQGERILQAIVETFVLGIIRRGCQG